ncbi:PBSX family phage terminase large subunit [Bradyrhizobium sp. SZCCHNR2032]|uniref:PBSX family phage terminase large subunit n=1 Tax=Bradyrhizobium sp. SZCCHNR2032 TaxID=3057384 RepID=UPI00291693E4|nr:phage terminase large subunit [Bradyrhizobium sp. SZCCHNR2032]
MATARLELPPKLVPVFSGEAMYRGAYGGRGSAKTRSFAKMTAVRALMWAREGREGMIVCGREFMNSLADSSFAEVKAAISSEPWLADAFDCGETYIRTKCSKIYFAFVGLRHNLDSIKSKARILLLWVDEAENVSETAWVKAIPTVREEGAEIWVTWNPERKKSATHIRFREKPPEGARIIELNWRDNPWFPSILDRTRRDDLANRADQYEWIWEGGFRTVVEGAYYAASLAFAKAERRIDFVARDPLMRVQAFFDIGGTGARADAAAIWIAQFVGQKINVLDYYEAQGQPLATHVTWLRERKCDNALIYLPHDGAQGDKVFATSYEGALREAGFDVIVIPNQGAGAARARIETARRVFPRVFFNESTTEAGREALGWYHEKRSDDERNVGLGPNHDWSSHGADAFGLMCIAYDEPPGRPSARKPYSGSRGRSGGGSWEAA